MGMTLVTFMSNSVAVKLDHHSFFMTLQRLAQEFGITGKDPVKDRNNTVAVKLDDDSFFTRSNCWNRSSASWA